MMVTCRKCRKPFDNLDSMYRKVCPGQHPRKHYPKAATTPFWYYIQAQMRYFQDPIYQFLKLVDEEWVNPSSNYRRKFDVEAITVI